MKTTDTLLKENGYDIICHLSNGAHGECSLVKRNNVSYILKSFYYDSKEESTHEAEIYSGLHGEGKGSEYFFKAERISIGETCFLLSQTYEGMTLEELILSGSTLSAAEKLNIIIGACKAARAMHTAQKGYAHLDIKPSNLYISREEHKVKPIDMGSAVLLKDKISFNDILNHPGYWSTYEYSSKRLRLFNDLRCEYLEIKASESMKKRLCDLADGIGIKDDLYSLICCLFFALTKKPFKFWIDESPCFSSDRDEIRRALSGAMIPEYLIHRLVLLFSELTAPYTAASAEVKFESADDLINELEEIREISENVGVHGDVLLRNFDSYFKNNLKAYISSEKQFSESMLAGVRTKDHGITTLFDIVDKDLSRSGKGLVLTSDGGGGKTVQLIWLCALIRASREDFLPIYLSLNAYDGSKDYIAGRILDLYLPDPSDNEDHRRDARISLLKSRLMRRGHRRIILMLDGINETFVNTGRLLFEISELAMLDMVSVIITSRYDISLPSDRFLRYSLCPLGVDVLTDSVKNYDRLNIKLKKLLTLPLYVILYLTIDDTEKEHIETAIDLIDMYFAFQLKKISRYHGDAYEQELRLIIYRFFPHYLSQNINSSKIYLAFADIDISAKWARYKEKHDIIYIRKSSAEILREFGIIKKEYDKRNIIWIFNHETYFDYFISVYFDNIIGSDSIKDLLAATDISSYYDIRHDSHNAYIYGKRVLDRMDQIDIIEDEHVTAAYIYSANGYSILHAGKEFKDAYDLADLSYKKSEKHLAQAASVCPSLENDPEYYRQKTMLNGNRGAYYLALNRPEEALKYHMDSLWERIDKKLGLEMIAVAYKNIGTDWFYLSGYSRIKKTKLTDAAENDIRECIMCLYRSYGYHKKALALYRSIHAKPNLDSCICINRMLGSAVKALELCGSQPSRFETLFGFSTKTAVEKLLNECRIVAEYFTRSAPVYDEIQSCMDYAGLLAGQITESNIVSPEAASVLSDIAMMFGKNDFTKTVAEALNTKIPLISGGYENA